MRPATQTDPATPGAWNRTTLRDPHRQVDKAARVRGMFNAIAPTYELVNRLLSFDRDAAWRRAAVAAADVCAGDVVLDVACGTGDMIRAVAAAEPKPARIIGVDFARDMLARGHYEGVSTPIELIEADALALPLPDASVDVISCAFGVRNFQDLPAGLREMARVARAGARVVILEFSLPRSAVVRWFYRFYCERIMPRLATLITRDRTQAYQYLPQSVQTFESPELLARRLNEAGFTNVTARELNFGGVVLYCGERARGNAR